MNSIRFQLFGISTYVHPSFLLLVGNFVYVFVMIGNPFWTALTSIICLFISVLVHELGHAAALRVLGFNDEEIRIHIHVLGGHVDCNESFNPLSSPEKVVVAIAGPSAGFLLVGTSMLLSLFARTDVLILCVNELVFVNILLSAVNLLPILPLDGGKAMQAIAHGLLGRVRLLEEFIVTFVSFTTILIACGFVYLFLDWYTTIIAGLVLALNIGRIFTED